MPTLTRRLRPSPASLLAAALRRELRQLRAVGTPEALAEAAGIEAKAPYGLALLPASMGKRL